MCIVCRIIILIYYFNYTLFWGFFFEMKQAIINIILFCYSFDYFCIYYLTIMAAHFRRFSFCGRDFVAFVFVYKFNLLPCLVFLSRI